MSDQHFNGLAWAFAPSIDYRGGEIDALAWRKITLGATFDRKGSVSLMMKCPLWVVILACGSGLSQIGFAADEPCPECGREPSLRQDAGTLEALGYPATAYTLLLAWSEAARDGSGKFVTGYRLSANSGGEPFDVYTNGGSRVLGEAELRALGIAQKERDPLPAETFAEPSLDTTTKAAVPPEPITVRYGIVPANNVVLEPVDPSPLLAEDAERERAGLTMKVRTGIIRELPKATQVRGKSVSAGSWNAVPGGSVWAMALASPGAYGIRVHFSEIKLPEGARVLVYNVANPAEVYGPYTDPVVRRSDLWSATCFGETAAIECFVPSGSDASEVSLTVDKVVHNYVDLRSLPSTQGVAGSCTLDVSCFTQWLNTSFGVAGVGSVGDNGSFFCSGCLLADTVPDTAVPYFLTANHCVGTQSEADFAEIYWFYQTSTCNGVPPDPAVVPRTTGGADLLATSLVDLDEDPALLGFDFTLLRLRFAPPGGVTFLGWSSAEAETGRAVVSISHPRADFKRIAFGDRTEFLLIQDPTFYYEVTWRPDQGVVEPGSSGSPLLLANTGQVVGQLSAGLAVDDPCDPSIPHIGSYGRFDTGYQLVKDYLDPPQPPSIQVTRPVVGARWQLGTRRTIKWVSNSSDPVAIKLKRNGAVIGTIRNRTKNDGKVKWFIPTNLTPGSGYTIEISLKNSPSVKDDSSTFSLRN